MNYLSPKNTNSENPHLTQEPVNLLRRTASTTPKGKPNPNILTRSLIFIIIIFNIFIPGIGTIISCKTITNQETKRTLYALGLISLITAPILIGFFISIGTSFLLYSCYENQKSIEDFILDIEKKKK